VQSYTAEVVRIRRLTHDVRDIRLRLIEPTDIRFKPGQFVSFEVAVPRFPRPGMRPYSIVSSPTALREIDLVLNFVTGGPGSTYLFGLREGDRTRFKGPAGSFYLRESTKRLLFVATGTGIAPFRSMLAALAETHDPRAVTLFWGLRSERDVYYQDELLALAAEHPRFTFVTTLSRPSGTWQGPKGRVTELVERDIDSVQNLEVYLCGNSGMIKDVTTILNRKGLCPIYREQYYEGPDESLEAT
jgi:CDP-4-dehydro-6-deoxyglucose reductase, E3